MAVDDPAALYPESSGNRNPLLGRHDSHLESADETLRTDGGRLLLVIRRLPWPDDTLRFVRDGYLFGTRGFATAGADAFRTRLAGIPVVVLRGPEAARFFYEGARFTRKMALPPSITHLLQDRGSVQTLEGNAHGTRKSMFLDLLHGEGRQAALVAAYTEAWHRGVSANEGRETTMLDFSAEVLADAALTWVGVPDSARKSLPAGAFLSMVDNAGRFGPPNWLARLRRLNTERAVRQVVTTARARPADDTPLSRIAHHRESGQLLKVGVAAVEVINILRPIVAVAHFIVFATLALHNRPGLRPDLARSETSRYAFAQEVRRYFPFFPAIAGRAARDLEWDEDTIARDSLVLLDLYGTDHMSAVWDRPNEFRPERFARADAHGMVVAQGAGDPLVTHHCPGEPMTISLLDETVRLLATTDRVAVPTQNTRISLRRFPATPTDRLRIRFGETTQAPPR